MTKIRFRQNCRHFMCTFTGHSKGPRNRNNNDLVCCAVSILGITLIQGVYDAYSRGEIEKINQITHDEKSGDIGIDLLATEDGMPNVLGAFSMIATGCSLLAEKYPENVALGREFRSYMPK